MSPDAGGGKKISRYTTPAGNEGRFQPGSRGRVLLNRLGIFRKMDMDRAEYRALLKAQKACLKSLSSKTRFTAGLICRMHRDWLGGIYDWAGQYRTVDVAKGGFRWPPAVRVAENMERFEKGLLAAHTPCRPGPIGDVARRIAQVHAELLLVHPFREGNGRIARWVADLMAFQTGLAAPDYGFSGRGSKQRRKEYLDAVIEGYSVNYEPLTDFFLAALARRARTLG